MRIVIGEDEALLREGLRVLLDQGDTHVVATAGDADELLAVVETTVPDLVITDIRMPPGHGDDGLQAALIIRARTPPVPVLVLSQYVQRQYALELLGADPAGVGYLLKQRVANVAAFRHDVGRVAAGQTVLDPEVVDTMLSRPEITHGPVGNLTVRQRQIVALIAEGRSNAAIAEALSISEKAVVSHTSHIYELLGLPPDTQDNRRVLAVLRYLDR
jgi:DNA-binding NarL/FixJ family response regulator